MGSLKIEWLYLIGGIGLALVGMFLLGGRGRLASRGDVPLKQMAAANPAAVMYPALSGIDDYNPLTDMDLYQYDKAANPDDLFNYSANESLRMYNKNPLGGFLSSKNSRQTMLYRPLQDKQFRAVANTNNVWSGLFSRRY